MAFEFVECFMYVPFLTVLGSHGKALRSSFHIHLNAYSSLGLPQLDERTRPETRYFERVGRHFKRVTLNAFDLSAHKRGAFEKKRIGPKTNVLPQTVICSPALISSAQKPFLLPKTRQTTRLHTL